MNAKDQAAELREQAERTREALGETVQQLSDKLDVQARASEGMQKAGAKAQQVAATAADKAQQVAATTADKAQQATAQVKDTAMHTLTRPSARSTTCPRRCGSPPIAR